MCVCVCVNGNRVPFFFILCNFIAIFFSAWPSHLARLALAISKWLCSFFIANFFLCMNLSNVNISVHEIKDCCCCCCIYTISELLHALLSSIKTGLHVSTLFYDISSTVIKQMSNMYSRTSDEVMRYFFDYLMRHFEYPMMSAWRLGA